MQNTMGEKKENYAAHCRGELLWCTGKNNAKESRSSLRSTEYDRNCLADIKELQGVKTVPVILSLLNSFRKRRYKNCI